MGRPRKLDKMTRVVTARVTDEQFDFLAERAVHHYGGDLSQAVREAVVFAEEFLKLFDAEDVNSAFRDMLHRWEEGEGEPYRPPLRMDRPKSKKK
jgi:hypothetical protein